MIVWSNRSDRSSQPLSKTVHIARADRSRRQHAKATSLTTWPIPWRYSTASSYVCRAKAPGGYLLDDTIPALHKTSQSSIGAQSLSHSADSRKWSGTEVSYHLGLTDSHCTLLSSCSIWLLDRPMRDGRKRSSSRCERPRLIEEGLDLVSVSGWTHTARKRLGIPVLDA